MFNSLIISTLLFSLEKYGERNAFCIEGEYYSYARLKKRIAAVRKVLHNVSAENIGLVANDDLDTYASILAVWMEGKCYVPLHPDQPLDRCMDIITQVEITTILDSSKSTRYRNNDVIITSTLNDENELLFPQKQTDNGLAYILFTSGSTGRPKGVPISRGNVAAFVDSVEKLGITLKPEDRCLQMFDLTFDLSVQSYLLPLLAGACVYTVSYKEIKYQAVFALLDEYHLTAALMVPSVIHSLRPYMEEINIPEMRYSLFCGEALNIDDAKAWYECVPNANVWNMYGPTECTIYCTAYRMRVFCADKQTNGNVCIGKAMPGVKTMVIDDKGIPCDTDVKGELCLAGAQLTQGYWNDEKKNNEAFFIADDGTRYYRTGDICSCDALGDIEYYGRKDSQVKVNGYRVELSEIECVARNYYDGKMAVVAVVTDRGSGNTIKMAVEQAEGNNGFELKSFLQSKLPSYMIPREIHFLKKFPQNTNNKIDRKLIKEIIG